MQRKLFLIAQSNEIACRRLKLAEAMLHGGHPCLVVIIGSFIEQGGIGQMSDLLHGIDGTALKFPLVIFQDVKGNGAQPRPERLAAIELLQPTVSSEENFLRDVVGIVRRVHAHGHAGADAFLMQRHELGKGLQVTCLGFADQFWLVEIHQVGWNTRTCPPVAL